MENTRETDYMEIFTELMKFHYPEIEISEKSNFKLGSVGRHFFKIDSSRIQFYFHKSNFYFELDPDLVIIKNGFEKSGDGILHKVSHLKFDIFINSANNTYSYPKFRNYLGNYDKNIFMQATYMFACVNYCINLFKDYTIK